MTSVVFSFCLGLGARLAVRVPIPIAWGKFFNPGPRAVRTHARCARGAVRILVIEAGPGFFFFVFFFVFGFCGVSSLVRQSDVIKSAPLLVVPYEMIHLLEEIEGSVHEKARGGKVAKNREDVRGGEETSHVM